MRAELVFSLVVPLGAPLVPNPHHFHWFLMVSRFYFAGFSLEPILKRVFLAKWLDIQRILLNIPHHIYLFPSLMINPFLNTLFILTLNEGWIGMRTACFPCSVAGSESASFSPDSVGDSFLLCCWFSFWTAYAILNALPTIVFNSSAYENT